MADLPSIDSIIDSMEELNQPLYRLGGAKPHSIRNHLEYMINQKRVSFDERRFNHLFTDRNCSYRPLDAVDRPSSKSDASGPDYRYHEKLSGLVVGTRRRDWEDERITEFVNSLKS